MKNVSEVTVFDLCILFYIRTKFRDNVSKVFRVICILKVFNGALYRKNRWWISAPCMIVLIFVPSFVKVSQRASVKDPSSRYDTRVVANVNGRTNSASTDGKPNPIIVPCLR